MKEMFWLTISEERYLSRKKLKNAMKQGIDVWLTLQVANLVL